MDSNLISAIVTSVTAAASTAGVAITAIVLSNKRIDRVEAGLDRLTAAVEMLTGSLHDLDKRLSLLEDRILNRPN